MERNSLDVNSLHFWKFQNFTWPTCTPVCASPYEALARIGESERNETEKEDNRIN